MKPSTVMCFLLFLLGILLGLAQLWFRLFDPELFFKLIVTDAALFVIGCVWIFLVREHKESRKINGGNSLD